MSKPRETGKRKTAGKQWGLTPAFEIFFRILAKKGKAIEAGMDERGRFYELEQGQKLLLTFFIVLVRRGHATYETPSGELTVEGQRLCMDPLDTEWEQIYAEVMQGMESKP